MAVKIKKEKIGKNLEEKSKKRNLQNIILQTIATAEKIELTPSFQTKGIHKYFQKQTY
jgi:FKBP-type peptidyl-prolyl cis-trans isomerase (trigger factor)